VSDFDDEALSLLVPEPSVFDADAGSDFDSADEAFDREDRESVA
jgi:hypothetical protein